ncbi:MAG: hypothetical protein JNJ58_11820 [Chitinophagaceae bacterium]|nr:hypothetical protein [Chitinophagaceae bacterium]
MDKIINEAISTILSSRKDIMPVFLRQKAKFEGWLKFELAHKLEKQGMKNVEVESKHERNRSRCDIAFEYEYHNYKIELKTPNTNWKIAGIKNSIRPITKNIQSIIDDTRKLNSSYGIVAFVLFPIPIHNTSWKSYIERINERTGIEINESNYRLLEFQINKQDKCKLLVCSFKSRVFNELF